MNNITEKYNPIAEVSKKLDDTHDFLVKATKVASLVGSICGFIYLLAFTSEIGIPFPLELSVLPTTLLVVGVTSLIGTFMIIGGVFVPAVMADGTARNTNGYFIARDVEKRIHLTRLERYFKCTWIPMALALTAFVLGLEIITKGLWAKIIGGTCLLFAVVWVYLTPRYVDEIGDNKWQYFGSTLFQILLAVWAYSLTILLAIAVSPELDQMPAWKGALIVLVVFSFLHMMVSVPTDKGRGGLIVLAPHFKHETTPAVVIALIMTCVLTAYTVFMPQINSKIGRTVLRVFRMGGGVPAVICLKSKPPEQIEKRISFGDDGCSETVFIQLDSGDRVYVTKTAFEQKNGKAGERPLIEPIYLRQDDIRQKIYIRLSPKNLET